MSLLNWSRPHKLNKTCIYLWIQYSVCYNIMGLNSNAHVLSKGLMIVTGVLRGWIADNKDTGEEAAEHENQSHPQHPPSPCEIHVKIWTSKSCPSISAHLVLRSRMKQVHCPPGLPLPCLQIWNNENTSFVYGREMFHTSNPLIVSCHCKFSKCISECAQQAGGLISELFFYAFYKRFFPLFHNSPNSIILEIMYKYLKLMFMNANW